MNPEYPARAAERWMLKKRQQAYREAWINVRDHAVKKVKTPMRIAHITKLSKVRQQKFDNPTEREARKRSDWHKFEAAITGTNSRPRLRLSTNEPRTSFVRMAIRVVIGGVKDILFS